jgi:hypothetical protein
MGDDDDRQDHSKLPQKPARSLPSLARLGQAGRPVPTWASEMCEVVTEREYATGGLR